MNSAAPHQLPVHDDIDGRMLGVGDGGNEPVPAHTLIFILCFPASLW